jgi:hypothetical protein
MFDFTSNLLSLLPKISPNIPSSILKIYYGYCYLFTINEMPSYYKIGSSEDIHRRLQGFNSAVPLTFREYNSVVLLNGQCKSLEKILHKLFQNKRVKGEWFRLSDDDLRQIAIIFKLMEQWFMNWFNRPELHQWLVATCLQRAHPHDFNRLGREIFDTVFGNLGIDLADWDKMSLDNIIDSYIALTATAIIMAEELHLRRNSTGFFELLEDYKDIRPIVDGARPGVYAAFSKKPRRLPGENKPSISE